MAPSLCPRSVLLCVLLLFSTNALAVSAVLGVDFGTEYIKAALVKPGIPLEIVLTKDSRRKETSAVAFKPGQNAPKAGAYPERLYGSDAMALAARFPGDVYPNLKTLLGLPADDALVAEYLARHPALALETHKVRGGAAFKSRAFTDDVDAWMVEELLAMELQSIQRNAEALAGSDTSVRSVVITVPPFYTTEEKRALELAADLIGLKVLSLISDGLAVGLNYATSRIFPSISEGGKPEHHLVFDMGAGSTSATILRFQGRSVKDVGKFNKTVQEVAVLGTGWDKTLGGDGLNYLIVDDMISRFIETPAAKKGSVTAKSVQSHGRAMAKLLKEAERLRHVLSANADTQTSFEGLYDDIDFKYKISRADFETMAELHVERVANAVQKALDVAELDISQLDSVVLHGGASRTPFVQKALEKIAGPDKIRGNVNSDEAAVFGAGFRAADLSPSFRVKEIRTSDAAAYPVGMRWTSANGKAQQQRLWTERSFLGAAPKESTFPNLEDFSVQFWQQVPSAAGAVEKELKTLHTKNLTASVASLKINNGCLDSDIHFKVQMRLRGDNGEVDILKASVECEAEEPEKEGLMDGVKNLFGFGKNKDQQPLGEEDADSSTSGDKPSTTASTDTATTSSQSSTTSTEATASASSSAGSIESGTKSKATQLVVIPVQYVVEKAGVPELPKAAFTAAKDRIKAFEASDRSRRQREETLNQLEAFTYKVRDLLENESFLAASTPGERAELEKKSSAASDWLYEGGVDASRDELKARLKELKDLALPVERRIQESQERPSLVRSLRDVLNQTGSHIDSIKDKIAEAEAFHASSSTSSQTSSTTTAAPSSSSDDFADLEDDDTTRAATKTPDKPQDRGPAPPLYTLEDLKGITELATSTKEWLEKKLSEQERLPETADPVLTVKDITEKTKELEKAGVDLAMKAVRNYDSKSKKGKSGSSKPKKGGKAKTKDSTAADAEQSAPPDEDPSYIQLGKDGKEPTAEEIDELVRKLTKDQQDKEKKPSSHDEL